MSSYALPPTIAAFLRRSRYGVNRINQRGSAISAALQPFAGRAAANYAPIQAMQSSLGPALSGSLTGLGQSLGGDIGSALSGIQAPGAAVSQFGGGAATTGAQSGQAVGALSSADVQRLHGEATAEQIYAAALPHLAELAEAQERRAFMEDAQQQLADLAAMEAENAYARQQDQREWQRQMQQDRIERRRYQRETRYKTKQDRLERQRQAKLDRLATQAAKREYGLDLVGAQQAQERIDISKANYNLAVRRQNESEEQFRQRERRMNQQFQARMRAAKAAGKKPNASLSAKYGYMVDSYGKPILTKKGKRIPVRSDNAKSKPWEK